MISEKERENRDYLFKLMQENPELPVIPFVDSGIPADDSGYWLGSWGAAHVDEYLFCSKSSSVLFKSDDDVFDALERFLPQKEFEELPESESDCRPTYDALPWIKAIIVYIDLPE